MKKQFFSILLAIILLFSAFSQMLIPANAANPPQGNAWNTLYYDYIVQDKADAETSADWEYVTYELIHLNDDAIPELWITYQYSVSGCRLATIADGAVAQELLSSGYLSYNPRHSTFIHTSGRMDVYYERVYNLDHGSLETVAEGRSEITWASDGSSSSTDYYWNDIIVTEEAYTQARDTFVDPDQLQSTNFEESCQYSYDEILNYLTTVEIIDETEPPSTSPSEEATEETTQPETEPTEPLQSESPVSPTENSGKNHTKLYIGVGLILCNLFLIFLLIKLFRR